ncbi:MAG: hypothetical protein Q7T08_01275, partial [Devosia sp.]|nr:hypothetical protein [Devosia sp.]
MTMPSSASGARPRAGKNAFRPRGASADEAPQEASWAEMLGPLGYIYRRYWGEARWLLAGVAVIVMLSSVVGIAAPYVFSRLIDGLRTDSFGETIVWAFAGYGILFGLSQALNGMVSYMAMMSAENLNFIAGTA